MASNYARGRGLEYRVKAFLEAFGCWVIRAASSKGLADLVALRRGGDFSVQVIMVSCKLGKGGAPPRERQALAMTAMGVGAVPLLAWQRKPRACVEWYGVQPDGELRRIGESFFREADGRLLPTGEPT